MAVSNPPEETERLGSLPLLIIWKRKKRKKKKNPNKQKEKKAVTVALPLKTAHSKQIIILAQAHIVLFEMLSYLSVYSYFKMWHVWLWVMSTEYEDMSLKKATSMMILKYIYAV